MKRFAIPALLVLALGALLLAGCGTKAEASACAGCGHELAAKDAVMVGGAAYCKACAEKKAGEAVTARHDCAGGCGMMDWPEDQMTQIDGQWYCKGCAANLQGGESHDHDHGDDDHGHDHG